MRRPSETRCGNIFINAFLTVIVGAWDKEESPRAYPSHSIRPKLCDNISREEFSRCITD